MRAVRTGRVLRAACVLTIATMLLLSAAPAVAAGTLTPMPSKPPAAASPAALPRASAPVGASAARMGDALGAQIQVINAASAQLGILPVDLAAQVTPSDVPVPFDGFYYWSGTTLVVDGWVINDTTSDVGPIAVGIVVQNEAGEDLAQIITAAAIYNLAPGRAAVFQAGTDSLATYAGQDMTVLVSTYALQPSQFPDAVNLTVVDGEYKTLPDGSREYSIQARNDSGIDVWEPFIGGIEFDSSDIEKAVLLGYQEGVRIPSGATVTLTARALVPGITPAWQGVYVQAVPAPPSTPAPVYRFYNSRNNSHFYTPSDEERDQVMARLGHIYKYEGVAYTTNLATNSQSLFRFFYKRGGTHFYTADYEEAVLIVRLWSDIFVYEGTTYPVSRAESPGALTVYRFLNRKNSSHFYTASAAERDYVKSALGATYIYEGPAFYIAP